MSALCGADCGNCPFKHNCRGCSETNGHPFGGNCLAAECIKEKGYDAYTLLKRHLIDEFNGLNIAGIPPIDTLYELNGRFVNLAYTIPNGEQVKLLNDNDVYAGTQIPCGEGSCRKFIGFIAGRDFLLISRYGENGSAPEIILYKKR